MFTPITLYFDDLPEKERAVDLWIPENPVRPVTLYFIHGGGWRAGHRENLFRLMQAFYKEGYACATVCYRLAGATVPDQLSDVREGLSLVKEQLEARGLSSRIVLQGSSAGGHLALLAGLAAPGACGESFREGQPEISGIVASCAPTTFEPWEDIFPPIWASMQSVAGKPHKETPELYKTYSPATYAGPQSPPILFLQGECEHMFPNDQTLAFAERLRAMGSVAEYHVYRLAEHGFFYDTTRNAQRAAFQDFLAFLERIEANRA